MNNETNNADLIIRIDRLRLQGISLTSYQQWQLKETVESELSGLFSINGIRPAIKDSTIRLRTDPIQLHDQKPAPDQLGKQIATAIYNSLTSEGGNGTK